MKRPHYFYAISKDSETGKALAEYYDRCVKSEEAACAFVRSVGGTGYAESPVGMAGGVAAVEFEDKQLAIDHGWSEDVWFEKLKIDGVGEWYPDVPDDFDPSWLADDAKEGDVLVPPIDKNNGVSMLVTKAMILEKQMQSLPIVSESELITILKFRPRAGKNGMPLPMTFGGMTPKFWLYNDKWYVDMPYECISQDCEMCTEKEYYRREMAARNVMF